MTLTLALSLVFWICIFVVFYSYLGYGILLGILIKLKRLFRLNEHHPDKKHIPSVSLIVPCFNEGEFIREKIQNTLSLAYPKDKLEVIFISDGSDDQTQQIIANHADRGITAMHKDERKGKAAAMNRAVKQTNQEILIFCDANTMLNENAILEIVKHFANEKVGAVAGQKRIIEKEADSAAGAGEGIYWKYESQLKKWDSELYTVVGAAGELMAYRNNLYEELEPDTLLDDFMQSMRIAEKGYRVIYEPNANATETASANVQEEIKRKVRIAAGGWQSMGRLPKAANPFHDFMLWFQYVSHRVLRWSLGTFCLILLLPLNVYLAFNTSNAFYFILLIGQVFFYVMAAIGWILENKKIRVKVLYIPYYFMVMNYSVIAGMNRHFKGSQSALWERAKRG